MHGLRRFRFLRMTAVTLLLGMAISGCTLRENAGGDPHAEAHQAQYAMVLRALSDPAEAAVKQGVEAEAEKQGVTVDIFAVDSADDLDGQLALLQQCIETGYRAVGVSPLTADNLVEGIAKASQQDIYIVNLEKETNIQALQQKGGSIAAFVAADPLKDGENAANYMLSRMTAGGDIAMLAGSGEDAVCEARRQGAEENFRVTSGVRVVETRVCDGDAQQAFAQTADLLEKYPQLKGIYACNDAMALGAVRAAEEAGRLDTLWIVGSDGTPQALESVQAGRLSATVAVDFAQIGAVSLQKMIEAVRENAPIDPKAQPQTVSVASYIAEK